MELSAVDLMAFMLFSQLAIAAYLLYSFSDQERLARRRSAQMLAQIERLFAELEKRAASGTYRGPDELDRIIARGSEAPPVAGAASHARARAPAT